MRWIFCKSNSTDGLGTRGAERLVTIQPPGHADTVASVKDLRVLLIDDGDTRDFLANTLRHYGADVTAVGSVAEALAALGRIDPQVLVCNCDMSDVDAAMLSQKLRRLEAAQQRRIPTIAAAPVERVRQASLGVHISLPRPLNPQALVHLIGKLALAQPAA